MATLNISETTKVRDAMNTLARVKADGYDPNSADSIQVIFGREIAKAHKNLHDVWSKKGHFSG